MGEITSYIPWKRRIVSNPALVLLVTSILSLVLYLVLALRYQLEPSLADPRANWVSLNGGSQSGFFIHLLVYFLLTLFYVISFKSLSSRKSALTADEPSQPRKRRLIYAVIVISWFIFSLVMMTSAPAGESHDIFDYVFRGRMMVESNANPLIEIPRAYRTNAFIRYVAWQRNVDTYGPLWEMTSFGVSTAVHKFVELLGWDISGLPSCPKSSESCSLLIAYLTSYRLLAVTLTGITALLIASMVKRSQPGQVPAALVAWLWNPLTLVASAVGAHNDFLMIPLLLLGLWWMQRQWPFLALISLILAAHVKLTALIWLPLFILWTLKKWGWRRAIIAAAASTAVGFILSWLLYLPFDGWSSIPRMLQERTLYLANSIWQTTYTYLHKQLGWPKEDVLQMTTELPTWIFIGAAILLSLWLLNFRPKRWQRSPDPFANDDRRLWAGIAWISLLYLIIGAFWFQHWYVLWVLAPAALLPRSKLTQDVLPWLSFGALSANLAQGFLLEYNPKDNPRTWIYLITTLIIWGPALMAGLIALLVRRLRSGLQAS